MVLPVLLDDLGEEDVIVGAVLVQAVKVEHPRLLGALTADLVRCLAALKLRDQLTDERIGLLDILAVAVKVDVAVHVVVDAPVVLADLVRADDRFAEVSEGADRDVVDGDSLAVLPGKRAAHVGQVGATVTLLSLTLLVALALALAVPNVLRFRLKPLTRLLHRRVAVEELGKFKRLLKGFNPVHQFGNVPLLVGQRDGEEARNAPLEVAVQTGDHVHLVPIQPGKVEKILVDDLAVAQEEVAARTGVLHLHQLFDADILNHVADVVQQLLVVSLCGRRLKQTVGHLVGSPQRVADLMRDEHGAEGVGDIPHGHDEVPRLDIERSSLRFRVEREGQVLACEGTGKDGERGVHTHMVAHIGGSCNPHSRSLQVFL